MFNSTLYACSGGNIIFDAKNIIEIRIYQEENIAVVSVLGDKHDKLIDLLGEPEMHEDGWTCYRLPLDKLTMSIIEAARQ